MRTTLLFFLILLPATLCGQTGGADAEPKPWRLDAALGTPSWLSLRGHQRTRYESLDENFRANRSGSNQMFLLRTALEASARFDGLEITAEGIDSRVFDFPGDATLNTTLVNSVELLQGYVAGHFKDVLAAEDELMVQAGRITMDVGSRRLVARNRFRNTINSFTGVNSIWSSDAGRLQAFFVIPTQRLPNDALSLRDNDIRWDQERTQRKFWAVHYTRPDLVFGATGEVYLVGLDEQDGRGFRTRDRDIRTAGVRLRRKPKEGAFDFEVESMYQWGNSHASTANSDTANLNHKAHFQHLTLGYTFQCPWQPRVLAQFDYASGDEDPTDGENNRFETLFGARRFELGPTNILGAFARANLISPGYRLILQPSKAVNIMLAHRYHYLASDQDAWTTSGLRDATGAAGDYIGNMAEIRVRWTVVPDSFKIEAGFAQLWAGSFIDDAPNRTTQGDVSYGYAHWVFTF